MRFVIEITFVTNWTTMHERTSCKKILVNYNADPLFVESMSSNQLTTN